MGVSVRDARTIARIVRVNRAGEYGAIRICSAQILVARAYGRMSSPI
jgi:3-demethoxyubiquinol 3-hydroxylase